MQQLISWNGKSLLYPQSFLCVSELRDNAPLLTSTKTLLM